MRASAGVKMGPLLLVLLAEHIALVSGLRGTVVQLSDSDRKELFNSLNGLRAGVGSSNMECLTGWSAELEAEAKKIAAECTASERKGALGVGVVYKVADEAPTTAEYIQLISQLNVSSADGCKCTPHKEADCRTFKQFALWNAGKVGCAKAKCTTPKETYHILTCVFDRWVDRDACAYSVGTACSFCSEELTCVRELCCAPGQGDDGSCGAKPAKLVPLYRLYNSGQKSMLLTAQSSKKDKLLSSGYSDIGILGYIVSEPKGTCAVLKPLREMSLANELDSIYLTDELSIKLYAQRGYLDRGIIGYVVDNVGYCSSTVSAYHFLVSDVRSFYTSNQVEATQMAERKGKYSSFWYQGIPFALWTK